MSEKTPTTGSALLSRAQTKKLPLMEMFGPTFQGEGAMCGHQTYFFRFGLCDYECTMCDSLHAINPKLVKANAKWLTQVQILKEFSDLIEGSKKPAPTITYSGGNPCIHDLSVLTASLKGLSFFINVETQGTLCPDWLSYVDLVTVSPKSPGMGEKFEPEVFKKFITKVLKWQVKLCLKIVVFSNQDLEFADMVFDIARELGMTNGFYLSLGNSYPPMHVNTELAIIHANKRATYKDKRAQQIFDDSLRCSLLNDYRILCEDILMDSRFTDVIFLPQLHVLTWANKAEV